MSVTTKDIAYEASKVAKKLREEGRHQEAGAIEQCYIRLLNLYDDSCMLRDAVGLQRKQ